MSNHRHEGRVQTEGEHASPSDCRQNVKKETGITGRTRQRLSENHYEHQRDTPTLLHTEEDFPVIQPAIVIRVSVNLAEQK